MNGVEVASLAAGAFAEFVDLPYRLHRDLEGWTPMLRRDARALVDPAAVVGFYRDTVIPLTKEGEVRYLLNRKS